MSFDAIFVPDYGQQHCWLKKPHQCPWMVTFDHKTKFEPNRGRIHTIRRHFHNWLRSVRLLVRKKQHHCPWLVIRPQNREKSNYRQAYRGFGNIATGIQTSFHTLRYFHTYFDWAKRTNLRSLLYFCDTNYVGIELLIDKTEVNDFGDKISRPDKNIHNLIFLNIFLAECYFLHKLHY